MKALVLHGFTGSLDTVTLLKERLEERGIEARTPVLRGHGTEPEHLFRVHWRDWVADARGALLEMSPKRNEPILLAGLSMGALVAAIIAAEFPSRVRRLALLAPVLGFRSKTVHLLPLIKRVFRTWAGDPEYADPALLEHDTNYERFPVESFEQLRALVEVAKDILPHINCPVATFLAKQDPVVPVQVLKVLDKRLGSGPTDRYLYKKSLHELLLDVEKEQVADDVTDFLLS